MMQIYNGKFANVFARNLCIIMYVNIKRITFTLNCIKIMLLYNSEYPCILKNYIKKTISKDSIVFKDEGVTR